MDNKLMNLDELRGLGDIFVKSGFFADARDASQAIVKILAGRELGIGPIASMQNVYIVNGRPSFSASVIAARIKSSGKYDYRVTEHDATKCTVEFHQSVNGKFERIGISTFTAEDARKAGTKNLEKYPRNMLFARALTNGARWYCPDVFSGVVYTPDELGADVVTDDSGEVVRVIEVQQEQQAPPEPPPAEPAPGEKGKHKQPKILTRNYSAWIKRIGEEIPHYAQNGEPNTYHIVNAIGAMGYTEITDENLKEIFFMLKQRAKQSEEEKRVKDAEKAETANG